MQMTLSMTMQMTLSMTMPTKYDWTRLFCDEGNILASERVDLVTSMPYLHSYDQHSHDQHSHDQHSHDQHSHDQHSHDQHSHDQHSGLNSLHVYA